MAEAITLSENNVGTVRRVSWSWTSAADGSVGAATGATTEKVYDGQVVWLVTDPGATAPTDNWDLAINDANGVDVLAGAGANRDTANTEYVAAASLGYVASSKLTIAVTNAGSGKTGTVYVYIR